MPQPTSQPADTQARSEAREALASFFGLCAFVCTSQLYDNFVILESVPAINYGLFTGIVQIATLAIAALAAKMIGWRVPASSVCVAGIAASVSMITLLATSHTTSCFASALVLGASLGWLALAWAMSLADLAPQSVMLRVLSAFFVSAGISLACFHAQLIASACVLICPLAAGFLYAWGASARATSPSATTSAASAAAAAAYGDKDGTTQAAKARPGLIPDAAAAPASFLAVLATCSLVCAFFAGITCYPYCFQSDHVASLMHVLSLAASLVMLVAAFVSERTGIQPLFVGALVLLLGGLLLFSTGILGSIITPLGLILTAKNCLVALGWAAVGILLGASRKPPALVAGCGLILGNATLGRCVGMFVNNNVSPDFSDVATGASVCIAAFAIIYAITASRHTYPRTAEVVPAPTSVPTPVPGDIAEEGTAQITLGEAKRTRRRRKGASAATAKSAKTRLSEGSGEVFGPAEPVWLARLQALEPTNQEFHVASLILQRQTYSKIAQILKISERTVKFHAKNIYEKAGVTTRRDFEIMMHADKLQ